MNNNNSAGCLIDAHVHIYNCFDLGALLDSAINNFEIESKSVNTFSQYTGVLLLTETAKDNAFEMLRDYAVQSHAVNAQDSAEWVFQKLDEDETSIVARRSTGQELFLMAGRQIVTKEGLEVLALLTPKHFKDQTPTEDLLHQVNESNAIAVLPWGVGKWLGGRGKYLSRLIRDTSLPEFFLGDNSGRPVLWQNPGHFQEALNAGKKILPGTDPLPISTESGRVGSFGFALACDLSNKCPSETLKAKLLDPSASFLAYGKLDRNLRFLVNQIKIRM